MPLSPYQPIRRSLNNKCLLLHSLQYNNKPFCKIVFPIFFLKWEMCVSHQFEVGLEIYYLSSLCSFIVSFVIFLFCFSFSTILPLTVIFIYFLYPTFYLFGCLSVATFLYFYLTFCLSVSDFLSVYTFLYVYFVFPLQGCWTVKDDVFLWLFSFFFFFLFLTSLSPENENESPRAV